MAVPTLSVTELCRAIARQGHRITRPRRRVIDALAAAGEPTSAKALHQALGPGAVDLVTVYRTLRWLVDLGVARAVVTGGAERFELAGADDAVQHLRCDVCGTVRTVSGYGVDQNVVGRIEEDFGFAVDHQRLVFHGRCEECAGRGGS